MKGEITYFTLSSFFAPALLFQPVPEALAARALAAL